MPKELASLFGLTLVCSGRSIEGTRPWPAGAVYAVNDMIVSGGNVTITKSEASENGGSGEVGCFVGIGTGGRGMPPQEVACRASGALQFGAEDKA